MRQMLAFALLTSLLVGVSGSASGQNVPQHDAAIAALAAQIKTVLNADSVLGTPRDFDGMKIVPIVNIFFGFGAGTGVSEERERAPGIGGGGGGGVTPVGLLVITKDKEVRVVAAKCSHFTINCSSILKFFQVDRAGRVRVRVLRRRECWYVGTPSN
jgi:uncharacterized spore protein YtfJ